MNLEFNYLKKKLENLYNIGNNFFINIFNGKIVKSNQQEECQGHENWLGNWKYRVPITIDHTKFSSDLTHFPLEVYIGSNVGKSSQDISAILSEIGWNHKKIAITRNDGITQLYVEVEKCNPDTNSMILHVSKNDWAISSSEDSQIYLYFDNNQPDNNDYIGECTNRTEVWNSDYIMVQHLNIKEVQCYSNSTGIDTQSLIQLSNGDLLGSIQDTVNFRGAYCLKSIDNGKTFTLLSTIDSDGNNPQLIKLSNGNIMTVYRHYTSPRDIKYKISTDNGATWGSPTNIDTNNDSSDLFTYTLSSGRIIIGANKFASPYDIWIRYSDDNGSTWSNRVVVDTPSIVTHGGGNHCITELNSGRILLAMEEQVVAGGNSQIVMWYSDDEGENWSSKQEIWNPDSTSDMEQGSFVYWSNNNEIWYISATDMNDPYGPGRSEVGAQFLYIKSTNNGQTWSDPLILKNSRASTAVMQPIILNNGNLLVWYCQPTSVIPSGNNGLYSIITTKEEIEQLLLEGDSTSYNNDIELNRGGSLVEGIKGEDFKSSVEFKNNIINYIDIHDSNSLQLTNELTLSLFAKPKNIVSGGTLLAKGNPYRESFVFMYLLDSSDKKPLFLGSNNTTNWDYALFYGNENNLDQWHLFSITLDQINGAKTFVDENAGATNPSTTTLGDSSNDNLRISARGYRDHISDSNHILFDEVRISKIARDKAWLDAEYNSLKDNILTFSQVETC